MKVFKRILSTSLFFLVLSVSCKGNTGKKDIPDNPLTTEEVMITIAHDANVKSVTPASLSLKVKKGDKWSSVKGKITVTYKHGWKLKTWNLKNKDGSVGAELQDSHVFNENANIFVSSQQENEQKEEVTISIAHDANVASVTPSSLSLKVKKGSKWNTVKGQITVTYKSGWTFDSWTFQKDDGTAGTVIRDDYEFNNDIGIFVSSKETFTITLTQPENGTITVKKLNDDHTEVQLNDSDLVAVPKNTNLKVELKAQNNKTHEPTLLKIDSKETTQASNGIITDNFTITKNTTIEGVVTAFFKITATKPDNGTITVERKHGNIWVALQASELLKVLKGKEIKITLSASTGFKPKTLSIKKEKDSSPTVINTITGSEITTTITIEDNLTLSGEVEANSSTPQVESETVKIGAVEFKMIKIPALTEPTKLCAQEGVTLDAYQFAQTEVTQALYKEVMGSLPEDQPELAEGQNAEKCPVAKISWYKAVAFCNELTIKTPGMGETDCVYYSDEGKTKAYRKADSDEQKYAYVDWSKKGFRLPTEAEWEAAALAREKHKYPGSNTLTDVAWCDESAFSTLLHEVATKPKGANAFKLYDMAGNIAEWVWDPYIAGDIRKTNPNTKNPTYIPTKDSEGSCAGYGTIRGGEYYANFTTGQYECTGRNESVSRIAFYSIDDYAIGIRLARKAM